MQQADGATRTFLNYFPEHIKNMSEEDQIAAIHECFYEESSFIGFAAVKNELCRRQGKTHGKNGTHKSLFSHYT